MNKIYHINVKHIFIRKHTDFIYLYIFLLCNKNQNLLPISRYGIISINQAHIYWDGSDFSLFG